MRANKEGKLKAAAVILSITLIAAFFAACQDASAPMQSVKPTAPAQSAAPTPESVLAYKNSQYGFSFSLPSSWKGYSVIEQSWEGTPAKTPSAAYSGPQILIRNPAWTEKEPTQDIPIMVFTLEQWKELSEGKFHIGAAPIDPSELGRNSRYVFALPARYNYAFLKGFEEVEKILGSKPLIPAE